MFEQEIELEKKQSGAIPLLLMVALILALVGVSGYFLMESRKVLAPQDAAQVVNELLKGQMTTVAFQTGLIKDRYDENAQDPRYRLLEKTGVIKIGKGTGSKTPVALTAKGKELLEKISNVQQSKGADGNQGYVVPLATRKLVEISRITMAGPERATIEYTWQWQTNTLGESFDAKALGGFNSWDRVKLIDKYGARFYHDAPTKVAINVVKSPQGWQLATE